MLLAIKRRSAGPSWATATVTCVLTLLSSVGHAQSTSDDLAPASSAPPAQLAPPAQPAPPAPSAAKAPADHEPYRLPALISLGVGGVLAGASVATGLIAKAKYDDAEGTCGPHCRDSQLSGSRTFAITSTVLTGAAVLGVGLGVALLLATEGDDEFGRNAPRFDVALSPSTAAAGASWSF